MLLLREADTGEVLTLQRGVHHEGAGARRLGPAPLRQSPAELSAELADLDAFALGGRDGNLRLYHNVATPMMPGSPPPLGTHWCT